MNNFKIQSSIHDYEVNFINDLSEDLALEFENTDVVLIDSKVNEFFIDQLSIVFPANPKLVVIATETTKSYQGVETIIAELIEMGIRKNNRLIAIGGGIIQDITAFIASILYRGIEWIFIPTTLLSQGDSCIGSKNSINFVNFKNQIGGFYPPNKILICPIFLESLSLEQIQSGLGEMLHYFIISSKTDFQRFVSDYPVALNDVRSMNSLVLRSLQIKKYFVELDEFDRKERQVLNYGHSFGHAIESLTNYAIPHGIAVSIGMDIANFISMKLGYISSETRSEVRDIVKKICHGYDLSNISTRKFLNALTKDKKNVGNKLGLILIKGYGHAFKELRTNDEEFESWIQDYFQKNS